MLIVLSPSKTLDLDSTPSTTTHTLPEFLPESEKLAKILKSYSTAKLSGLMDISDKLAALNASRFRAFKTPFTRANARQAIFTFKGDVYAPIEVESFQAKQFEFAQKHVKILSGLYGLLRPLDLIQPYRLEMGIALPTGRGKNLYEFWGERITRAINQSLAGHTYKVLINLASEEYFKAVQVQKLGAPCIHIVFKERQKGQLKIIGLFAKKARGLMTNYIIKNQVIDPQQLKKFKENGYSFASSLSNSENFVFTR